MLHVWNPRGGRCEKVEWCRGHWWWGEGDEKFFVDCEKFPSTFGTGTEDYFGYAWGNGSLFQHPYNTQTICEGNAGHICVSRWQIPDNVPFQKRFDGYMKKYTAAKWTDDDHLWWTGANEKAKKAYMFGLDEVRLARLPADP